MAEQLSQEERNFVGSELRWDSEERRRDSLLLLLALVGGGIVILVVIALTLRFFTDRAVLFLTVPGFALGVALILVYALGKRRLEQRHRVATILARLGAGDRARAE